MNASAALREGDLELIDALQVNPRASWADIGAVLDLDPVTVARRWKRLEDARLAWSTVALGQRQLHTMCVAFLELTCETGAASEVASELARQPHMFTVQHVAGSYDLWTIAIAPNLTSLSEYVLHQLPRQKGITRVRTHIATRAFDLSMRWRLRVLNAEQVERLRQCPTSPGTARPMDDYDRRLFTALSLDGRRSFTDLEAELGMTARTVQRRINRLTAVGDIAFRCDLARQLAGWHASAVLWLEMPDDYLERTGEQLLRWPETRTCAAIAGPNNLLLTVGLHQVADLHGLVTRLRTQFPHATIVDRQIVLRQVKLYGRVLDATGRWVSATPLGPWALDGR
ncbi:Lrp/AsnC family transcriptional regulator [Saccharopolyspora sp. 5N708]|uniref:Lrp/AsnC family transcriptional regulator n=1 Tax=Saccharopolyspora sp. 5N708 TaxID=3457424 RepID=UPI003FD61E1B